MTKQDTNEFRCGYVSLAGRSNVGKSTLLNAMVGEKLSIVTHKAQTTRFRMTGIRNTGSAQMLFVDVPGLHRSSGRALNRVMNRTALQAIGEADVVLFVVESSRWTAEDQDLISHLQSQPAPVVLAANKIDLVKRRADVLPQLDALSKRMNFADIVPVSATRHLNLDALERVLISYLPVGPALFPTDQNTDRSEAFHVSEIIREQTLLRLQQELPYGLQVGIEQFSNKEKLVHIGAILWVERAAQKGMVIGRQASMLKGIGSAARRELEVRYGKHVNLELWVKVRSQWSDNLGELQRFGYDT